MSTNRVVLGKRGTDFGLFVSRGGQNALTSTEPLGFDSRAAETLIVHSTHQGILVPDMNTTGGSQVSRTYNSVTYNQHTTTITHNLGYVPCFAVRWCTFGDLSSGLATRTFPPFHYYNEAPETIEEDMFEEGDEVVIPGVYAESGLSIQSTTNNTIVLKNMVKRQADNDYGAQSEFTDNNVEDEAFYFWSCVIFTADNFLNGESL